MMKMLFGMSIAGILMISLASPGCATHIDESDAWPEFRASSGCTGSVGFNGIPIPWEIEGRIDVRKLAARYAGFPTSPIVYEGNVYLSTRGNTESESNYLLVLEPTQAKLTGHFPSCGGASPLIRNGSIYYTDCPGIGSRLVCLDRSSLEVKWEIAVEGASGSSPACDGELVFITCGFPAQVRAFDKATGALRWIYCLGEDEGIAGKPALFGGRLYIISESGKIACLNATDGAEMWKVDIRSECWHSLVVDNEVAVTTTATGTLFALDSETGTIKWKKQITSKPILPPALDEGKLFVVTSDGDIIAVSKGSGDIIWRVSLGPDACGFEAAPTLGGQFLYVGDKKGRIHVLSIKSGEIIYTHSLTGRIVGEIALTGKRLYVITDDGLLWVLRHKE